jgi:2-aminophenol/2-amino-5-chlorophenol 1,6-dioxygenase subunit alpha
MSLSNLRAVAFVPGHPVLRENSPHLGHQGLCQAMERLQKQFEELGIKRFIYYSSQWMSVLGTSLQSKAHLEGLHVDENWHHLSDMPFSFQIDTSFSLALRERLTKEEFASHLIDYDHFPVDTGTIIADALLNKNNQISNMISCHVYLDNAKTFALGGILRQAIESGPEVPTAVVGVSLLSTSFHREFMPWENDHIREPGEDQWNRKLLGLIEGSKIQEALNLIPEYCLNTRSDMGLKALSFCAGVLGPSHSLPAQVLAYGPAAGAGAAVIHFALK